MSHARKKLQERFYRIKKALRQALRSKKREAVPQLILQPVRNRHLM